MARYRKKPVVIRAVQFLDTPESRRAIEFLSHGTVKRELIFLQEGKLAIRTPEGTVIADKGDWVIRGVYGGLYPCKPDIFKLTYEPVIEGSFHG